MFRRKLCLECFQLAISAASPIWRGYLAEIDCRWNVLCAMSDDRTAEERGFEVENFRVLFLRRKELFLLAIEK